IIQDAESRLQLSLLSGSKNSFAEPLIKYASLLITESATGTASLQDAPDATLFLLAQAREHLEQVPEIIRRHSEAFYDGGYDHFLRAELAYERARLAFYLAPSCAREEDATGGSGGSGGTNKASKAKAREKPERRLPFACEEEDSN